VSNQRAAGSGAASRQAIGTAVVGAMIAATVMPLVCTPTFYGATQRLAEPRRNALAGAHTSPAPGD
jgi:Cu/Ag efflux pump CusA